MSKKESINNISNTNNKANVRSVAAKTKTKTSALKKTAKVKGKIKHFKARLNIVIKLFLSYILRVLYLFLKIASKLSKQIKKRLSKFAWYKVFQKFLKKNEKVIRYVTPVVFGIAIFWFLKPLLVKAVASEAEISVYTTYNDLSVDVGEKSKISQIVYKFDGSENMITDEDYTNANPKSDGEFITWMGQTGSSWHIFTHNVTTGTTNQLTFSGNNVNPDISFDYVVWESMVNGVWQVMFFDGVKINQITHGSAPSLEPSVSGDYIVYSQMTEQGGITHIILYDTLTGETTDLTPNSIGWKPEIDGEFVFWHGSRDRAEVVYMYVIPTGELYVSSVTRYEVLGKDAFDKYVTNLVEDGTVTTNTATESTESSGSGTFTLEDATAGSLQQVSQEDILLELEQLGQAAQESTSSETL